MSDIREMEVLSNHQNQIMASMNRMLENYKKDGPSRRTVSNIISKLNALDGFWQEFLNNHDNLKESKIKDLPYLTENWYEKTKTFYESTKAVLTDHLTTAKQKPQSPKPSEPLIKPTTSHQLTSWAIEMEEEQSKVTRNPTTPSDQHHPQDNNMNQPETEQIPRPENIPMANPQNASRNPAHPGFAIPPISQNLDKSALDSSKVAEMMRKQQSNFKAFARTIFYIDLSIVNEKWELEDLLKTVQSRWVTIDSLHWDIDSELPGDDEIYNQAFCKYERKFQDIKKAINTKIWSMSHQEKSTPMMDIPPFSGNYQQWVSFKNLFNEAVHYNRSMSNAQKMQYLKNKVRGEAEKLIQHLNISSENYQTCWEILNHRYNNTKLIFTAHLNTLLSLPVMQHQAYQQIKRLHDTTNESLNAIKNLGVEVNSWDPLIVHILSQKLDTETHTEYIESLKNPRDLPKLKEFLDFLEMKFTSFEASRRKLDTPKSAQPEPSRKHHYKSFGGMKDSPLSPINSTNIKSSYQQRMNCPVCYKNHGIFHCDTFQRAKADSKRNIISKFNLCKNCLYNHYGKDCISTSRCRTCNEMHNTLVHDAYTLQSETNDSSNKRKNVGNVTQECNNMTEILLATALINIKAADGNQYTLRALIDQGSQMSLISENAAQLLQLPRQRCKGIVYGIGAKENVCKGVINVTASSLHSEFQFGAELYIMKTLMNHLPNRTFCKPTWSYLKDIQLADPEFNVSRPIDLLLGADVYATIIQGGIIHQNESLPVAQQTRLGWILCGKAPSYQCNNVISNMDDIMRFWTIEDITEPSSLSSEDQHCLQFYQDTTYRQSDGRYVVRLPLKSGQEHFLGNSKNVAIAQFKQLERKFEKNQKIKQSYKLFIDEYIKLGHMRRSGTVKDNQCNSTPDCYLPHHCVQRADSTTTDLRVVFNASAKTSNGQSLNDIMYSGPNLQQDLLELIIKWRQYKIAFTADLEKMFRQIFINDQDQKYQKIIWRDEQHQLLQEYTLSTVTYGTKAAPFLAMMTLRRLANDERHNYPEAANVVNDSFYMDDLLHGCHTIQSAKKLQSDLIALMKSGGFNLRKWVSNEPTLLEGVSKAQDLQKTYEFKDQTTTKTLGLRWQPQEDHFTFQLEVAPTNKSEKMTKRSLLSNIAKVFDPAGWLAPVSTKLKLLFQNVASKDLDWNDQISDDIKKEWETISQDLQNIKEIKVPRWLNSSNNQDVELHGFCDASTKAYACVIYCRVINNDDTKPAQPSVLVAAKSRLVPTKKNISLPRLELCAALLLSTLMIKVKQSLSNLNITSFGWSDSTAVLGWLHGEPSKWKPFISNRVTKITESMPPACWNYVKSRENPADCASRGITAQQLLEHPLWWNGPSWLTSYSENEEKPSFTTDQEVKISKQCHVATSKQTTDVINDLVNKCSSMTRATRILAWVLRATTRSSDQLKSSYLTTDELRRARNKIIKYYQEIEFADEINSLNLHQTVDSKSNISQLTPFLDQNGMLRVRGRLENAHISWEKKHPLIIPHSGRITDMLIDQAHQAVLHGGPRLTLSRLRGSYWIVGGNRATKKRLRRCVTCLKQKPQKLSQIMGDLPESRSNQTRPFLNTGVDYTGFVNVKANKGRGIKTTKGYIAVFICMSTKATHLELVSDLTSESFLAALRRMSARRGAPHHIYSDNGTNFVGANKKIREEYQQIKSTLDENFFNAISEMNISWHFNAPAWPSAGGLWESAVSSLKHHLRRVLGDQHLTFEEFSTLLAQIEGCLNARPLCALSEDPDDLDYLTPSHFLASGPTLNIIETERDERTRWRLTQKIFQDLWKRWQAEYLCQLQSRCKWTQPKSNIKIGDVVIIHEQNLPAGKWALGRVLDVHPGKDGFVRVASIKTKNGIIKRPIIKLSVLPVTEDEPSINQQKNNTNDTPPKNTRIRTRASSNKVINFISMALMLFMFIISPAQCNYNVSSFKDGQAIYFDKVTDMKLARDEWNLVVYYNIDPYWQGSTLLSKYINHLENSCHIIEAHSQCKIVLMQLRHAFSELKYYDGMLLGQRSELSRQRRGLINGIGNIAHSLFGVLDEQFAEQYQKDIELTRTNEKHLANLWKNQTSIIEAENNLLKRVEDTVQKQQQNFAQHLMQLESGYNKLGNQIQDTVLISEFTVSSIIANSILVNLKSIQETLLDTITNVIYGKFNIHLLTPQQLKEELNIISGQVPKDLTLPCENINTDLPKLYQLMKVRTRMTRQFLIFEIKIPLVFRDVYELFRLIPISHQNEKNMIKIIPIANQVAINMQKESFIPMLDEVVQKCDHYDANTLICTLQGPIYQLKSDDRLCVPDQVTKQCKSETDVCRNTWSELSVINTYLFFCCDECTARIICGQEVKAEHLHKAGIIALRKDCVLNGDTFTIFTQKRPISEISAQTDVFRFDIPSINHVINLTIPSIPLEPIDHDTNKKYFKVVKEQIEHMKTEGALVDHINYHDVHHYAAIYIVMAIVLVIAALYVRRCLRRRRLMARLTPPSFVAAPVGRGHGPTSRLSASQDSLQSRAEQDSTGQRVERQHQRVEAIPISIFRGFTSTQ